jgi:hypothetical protein
LEVKKLKVKKGLEELVEDPTEDRGAAAKIFAFIMYV